MPVIPPSSTQGYDTVMNVVLSARTRMNDHVETLEANSGQILHNTDAFMQQLFNGGWRAFQDVLVDRGYQRLTGDVVISGLPKVAVTDPAIFCWLSRAGCFDGVSYYNTPALPSDFTHPLKVWERQNGYNMAFYEPPMEKIVDGLRTSAKTTGNLQWEWRQDAIWFPGSLVSEDFRIRYANYLSDFVDSATTRWYQQTVPILRCTDALSWFVCAELENARKGGDAAVVESYFRKGTLATNRILNRDVRANQRVNIRRQSRSGRLEGYGNGNGIWY